MKLSYKIVLFAVMMGVLFSGCATELYKSGLRTSQKTDSLHQEGRIAGTSQINLFHQAWLPKQKSKAVVMIVHGLKDHSDRYADVAKKLSGEGYAIYSYDHRGHGDSEGNRVWVEEFNDYIADLGTYYDFVKKAEPNKPIFIFGHGMGGAIATMFSLRKVRSIQGMILSAPALKVGDDVSRFLIGTAKFLGTALPTLAVFGIKDENFSRDPQVIKAGKADPLIYHHNAPARTAAELLKIIDYIQDHMSEVSDSFLALHGDKDLVTNPEGSKELYQKAITQNKSLKIYPGMYHDLLHEPEKDQVYADILAWLNNEIKTMK
ncbi:MAG: lysophospholipase [Bdellovibrio sp.]|nr:lysophospholipase [Bdellovibrio sp.]